MTFSNRVLWADYPAPDNLPPAVIYDPALPLVSVVTPSYNQGKFVRETIESILTQAYPNIEYWVIDDGSTDETLSILPEYEADPRFHWISAPDKGQADAINKGWSRCRGEVLAWLNSDDTYLPGALRTQVEALLSHPNCGAVYGDARYVAQNGEPLYTFHGRPYNLLEVLRLTIPIQPTVFLRRWVCEKIGPVNVSFRYAMDSEYWARAAKVTDFWYQPATVATYRLHEQSKTVANYSGFYGEWIAILDAFYADPDMAKRHHRHKRRVYADVYSTIAATEVKHGSMKRGWHYLSKSLRTGKLRPRLLMLLPSLVDRHTSLDITPRLIQWWSHSRSTK